MREIKQIAADILAAWPDADENSKHYLQSMLHLKEAGDRHMKSSGVGILAGFYKHSQEWTGPDADILRREVADHLESKSLARFK